MKKLLALFLGGIMMLGIFASASAQISLRNDYIFSDGDTIYTFGEFSGENSPEEIGVKIGGKTYNLDPLNLAFAKERGRFGVGIKDSGNILGSAYTVTPYLVANSVEEEGAPITINKDAGVRNIKYAGPATDEIDTTPNYIENFADGTLMYTDNAVMEAKNIVSYLKNTSAITLFNPYASTTPSELKTAYADKENPTDWLTFDLYKSATIRVLSETTLSTETMVDAYGFEAAQNADSYYLRKKHKDYNTSDAYTPLKWMYSKHVDVENGQYETVSVPNGGRSNTWGYIVLIDWDGEEESGKVRNVNYLGPTDEALDTTPYLGHDLYDGTYIFTNSTNDTTYKVSPELWGKDYIIQFNYRAAKVNGENQTEIRNYWASSSPLLSFELAESATVNVLTTAAFANIADNYGYTVSNDKTYIASKWQGNAGSYNFTYLYSKHYDASSNNVTVTLPAAPNSNRYNYIVVIDYDNKEAGKVTNPAYAGPVVDGLGYNEDAVELHDDLQSSTEKMAYANNAELSFKDVDSSLVGKPYIIMATVKGSKYNSTVASAWFGGARDWVTFDINKSATIKVITDGTAMDNCGNYGFTKSQDEKTYFVVHNNTWSTTQETRTNMYYKTVYVPQGETVTITIPNAPTWTSQANCKLPHVVVIDFDNLL